MRAHASDGRDSPRPQARVRSSKRRAASTCIASTIAPSKRSAPPDAAAMSRSARAISSSDGAKAAWHGAIWSGWISDLAVEAERAALGAFGGEAFGIVERDCRPRRTTAMPSARAASTID